jgi:hypothetical protein
MEMKNITLALTLTVLAGCAGTPSTPPTPAHEAAQSGIDVKDPEKVTTDTIMAAQEGGQTIVDEEGQKMICRREKKTGSHLQQKTICMTKDDWDAAAKASRQTVEDMARQRPPRQGN